MPGMSPIPAGRSSPVTGRRCPPHGLSRARGLCRDGSGGQPVPPVGGSRAIRSRECAFRTDPARSLPRSHAGSGESDSPGVARGHDTSPAYVVLGEGTLGKVCRSRGSCRRKQPPAEKNCHGSLLHTKLTISLSGGQGMPRNQQGSSCAARTGRISRDTNPSASRSAAGNPP